MKIHLLLLLLLLVAAGVKTQDSGPGNCPVNEPINNENCDLDPSEICAYGELCCPGAEGCGNPDVSCRCQNGFFNCIKNIISCPEFCPPAQPSLGEFCDVSESDQFGCDFGELCCGEDCIPASTCQCVFNGWFCSDNYIACPQQCPETKPTFGQTCDIDRRFFCYYDQGVCASLQADESAVQCSCIDSAFECSSLCNDTVVDCPQDPSLISSPLCEFSNPSTTCSYGELCCPGQEGCGNPLVTCECNNDVDLFLCGFGTVSCPEACPASQPEYYESCDLSDRITCDYGELCCGEDCVTATTCGCGGGYFYCYNNTIPCPLVCPEAKPVFGDICDIDSRFLCYYDQEACSTGGLSNGFSVECRCSDDGRFDCYDYCQGNITECPDWPLSSSGFCNLSNSSESCDYGELCCPGDEGCGKPDLTCKCEDYGYYGYFSCSYNSISCPEACPASQPEYYESCDLSDRITCDYGELCCGEDCVTATTCGCGGGYFYCYNNTIPCPLVCPEAKPVFGDICDFDSRFLCYYDQEACSTGGLSNGFSVECRCSDNGRFDCYDYCQGNITECPDWPLSSYGFCDFSNSSESCDYSELCCPGDEGCGKPDLTCKCEDNGYYGFFSCSYNSISCPEACPASQPEYYESCDLSDRITCDYGELCCGEDCVTATTCGCGGGYFYCYNNTIPCPLVCPEAKPVFGDICDIDPRFLCYYDRETCSTGGLSDDFSAECRCSDNGRFDCYDNCQGNITECPDWPLSFYGFCDFSNSSESCDYGELCCPGDEGCGKPDLTCKCEDNGYYGFFSCSYNSISCPEACPASQPLDGEFCDFSDRFLCDYGRNICCGDDCIPASTCFCYFGGILCLDNEFTAPCPLLCPQTKPSYGDTCDIDPQIRCSYGRGACASYPSGDSVTCNCRDGVFDCIDFCGDEIFECPDVPAVAYPQCNFTEASEPCDYGQLCCPGDEGCVGEAAVSCICADSGFYCNSNRISCPESCPASQPMFFESCDLSDRIDCDYGELCCGEECGPVTTCGCFYGNWYCSDNNVLCPEACPKAKPAFGDSCSIDPHFICPYDQGTCNGLPDDAHAVECTCEDSGEFSCFSYCNDTAVECPDFPPLFSYYSCDFADLSEVCEYGEACCPGEEGCGLPRVTCECETLGGYFNCTYNDPFCPVDPTPGICDDDRKAKFYSPATGTLEPCVWLAARPEMQGIHCDPRDAASAYYLCEETCGQCTDDCNDDPLAYFEYENKETGVITLRNCHWLSLRNSVQDQVCKDSTSQAGTVCPETCNTCDM